MDERGILAPPALLGRIFAHCESDPYPARGVGHRQVPSGRRASARPQVGYIGPGPGRGKEQAAVLIDVGRSTMRRKPSISTLLALIIALIISLGGAALA